MMHHKFLTTLLAGVLTLGLSATAVAHGGDDHGLGGPAGSHGTRSGRDDASHTQGSSRGKHGGSVAGHSGGPRIGTGAVGSDPTKVNGAQHGVPATQAGVSIGNGAVPTDTSATQGAHIRGLSNSGSLTHTHGSSGHTHGSSGRGHGGTVIGHSGGPRIGTGAVGGDPTRINGPQHGIPATPAVVSGPDIGSGATPDGTPATPAASSGPKIGDGVVPGVVPGTPVIPPGTPGSPVSGIPGAPVQPIGSKPPSAESQPAPVAAKHESRREKTPGLAACRSGPYREVCSRRS
jgi:hypothetical protein